MFNLVLALVIGVSIGLNVKVTLKNDKEFQNTNDKIIKSYDSLMESYEAYIETLEEAYREALNDTLTQNIELKKKLKAYE